jgi:hypothetical protein
MAEETIVNDSVAEQAAFDAEMAAAEAEVASKEEQAGNDEVPTGEAAAMGLTETALQEVAEEEPPEEGTAERQQWDRERQERDQAAANVRKRAADLEAENERLKVELARKVDETAPLNEEDEVLPTDRERELYAAIRDLKPLVPLDEFATEEEKATRAVERERRIAIREELDDLRLLRESANEENARIAARNRRVINEVVRTRGGESIRNELTNRVLKEIKNRNATADQVPDIIHRNGLEIENEALRKRHDSVKLKPRTGGGGGGMAAVQSVKKTGSLEQIVELMKSERKGKV